MINLAVELHEAACTATHQKYQDHFVAAGISHTAIYGSDGLYGDFGVARAQFDGDLWEPATDGAGVFILGVNEHPDEGLIDIVAFKPSNPARWYLRLGNAVVLGLHNARLAVFKEEPVLVHATPLDWLRAECRGVVVLDWTADILSRLEGYGCLAADRDTGQRLERAFHRHINIPKVKVMGAHREAA
jgi:hypothetical protein